MDATGNNSITTIAEIETTIDSTTAEVLGHNAFENQMEYLKKTKKPKKISVDNWLRRIRNINFSISTIDSTQVALTNNVLIRDVILPNIPALLKLQLKSNGAVNQPWSHLKMMLRNMYAKLDLEAARRNNSRSNGRGNKQRSNGNSRNNNENKKRGSHKNDNQQENYRNKRASRLTSNEDNTSTSDSYRSDAEEPT